MKLLSTLVFAAAPTAYSTAEFSVSSCTSEASRTSINHLSFIEHVIFKSSGGAIFQNVQMVTAAEFNSDDPSQFFMQNASSKHTFTCSFAYDESNVPACESARVSSDFLDSSPSDALSAGTPVSDFEGGDATEAPDKILISDGSSKSLFQGFAAVAAAVMVTATAALL
ncbi:hypothetical protein CCR75_004788 [Bremia lactucae]|uniref:Uncharacterized protein n=1 Tax=Bremia lactucae TaxID=4779 RepID=A0A976IBQ3_BRELC|nr:hypothetical protein CCR75_004788 [Bremia lactucae]